MLLFFENIFKRVAYCHPFLFVYFLVFFTLQVNAQFQFDVTVQKHYSQIFTNEALSITELKQESVASKSSEGSYIYLCGLKYVIDYFVRAKYDGVLDSLRADNKLIKQLNPETPFGRFCLGESFLHLGFIQMAQSNKFGALLALKKSYHVHLHNVKDNPDFLPSQKTLGMLEIIFNEAQNYSEFSSLITGVKASQEKGQKRLETVIRESESFRFEANLFRLLIFQFVTYDFTAATLRTTQLLKEFSKSTLVQSITAVIYTKNNESRKALGVLQAMDNYTPYFVYLQGVNELQLLHHKKSIFYFNDFLKNNPSYYENSARFYMAKSYYLTNDNKLTQLIRQVEDAPSANLAADKVAKRKIGGLLSRNKTLLKGQLLFDGGSYNESLDQLLNVNKVMFNEADMIEYYYRLGRLYQELNEPQKAKANLLLVVFKSNNDHRTYFGPNACLQLAKLFLEDHKLIKAKQYLEAGLKYNHYEYQVSIKVQLRKVLEIVNNEAITK